MGFNDIGSELADPSAIATPLRPAEMFKVKRRQCMLNEHCSLLTEHFLGLYLGIDVFPGWTAFTEPCSPG